MRTAQTVVTRNSALSKMLDVEYQAPKRKNAVMAVNLEWNLTRSSANANVPAAPTAAATTATATATAAAPDAAAAKSGVTACPMHKMMSVLGFWNEGTGNENASSRTRTASCERSVPMPTTRPSIVDACKSVKSIVLDGQPKTNMAATWLHNFNTLGKLHRVQLSKDMDMVHAMRMEDHEKVIASEGACPKRTNIVGWTEAVEELGKPKGIFLADGPQWLEQRALFRKLMLSPENVRKYVSMLSPVVNDFMDYLHTIRSADGEIPNLDEEMHNYSSDCIVNLMFGNRIGRSERVLANRTKLNQCVTSIFRNCLTFFYIPFRLLRATQHRYWTEFVANFRGLFDAVEQLVADKQEEMQMQMQMQMTTQADAGTDAGTGSGSGTKHDDSIVANVLSSLPANADRAAVMSSIADIVGGGIDTTATAMQWGLYMLAKHPQVQSRIRDEVRLVVGVDDAKTELNITAEHIDKLQYVKAVVKEILRMYPVIPVVSRVLDKDVAMDEQTTIAAGSQFTTVTYAAGRNEHVFEQADQFRPERWLRDRTDKTEQEHEGNNSSNSSNNSSSSSGKCPMRLSKASVNRHATMPFGFGVRSCIGRRIAEVELYLFLMNVVNRYDVHCANANEVKEQWQILLLPSEKLRIQLKERARQ